MEPNQWPAYARVFNDSNLTCPLPRAFSPAVADLVLVRCKSMIDRSYLLLVYIGLFAWPILTFALARYHFKLSRSQAVWYSFLCLMCSVYVGIGLGDSMVSMQHAGQSRGIPRLFIIRGIFCSLPYLLLAVWLAVASIRRFRFDRTRNI